MNGSVKCVDSGRVAHQHVPYYQAELGFALLKSSDHLAADEILDGSINAAKTRWENGDRSPEPPFAIATVHAIRGEHGDALIWLRRAAEAGWKSYLYLDYELLWQGGLNEPDIRKVMNDVKADVAEMRRRVEAMKKEWK